MTVTAKTILLIDDDPVFHVFMEKNLEKIGYSLLSAFSPGEAEPLLNQQPEAVLLDLDLGGHNGFSLLEGILMRDLPVVVVTAANTPETALKAVELGASDFLAKPVDYHRLKVILTALSRTQALKRRVADLEIRQDKPARFHGLIGASGPMQTLYGMIRAVAAHDCNVLITGESGAGKELVATAVHEESRRAGEPFQDINCAAIPRELMESEIFGHDKGAFTGAQKTRAGLFEQAGTGSVFLDEVGEMALDLQAKLLRVLQERRYRRVGGDEALVLNARIISATNRDLLVESREGRFREDLYYRLDVVTLPVPALRKRREDIPMLFQYFFQQLSANSGNAQPVLSPGAKRTLMSLKWPGNIRQLRNVAERLLVFHAGEDVQPDDLKTSLRAEQETSPLTESEETALEAWADGEEQTPEHPCAGSEVSPAPIHTGSGEAALSPVIPMAELERRAILNAIQVHQGDLQEAANALIISKATLYRRLKEYGVNPGDYA